MELETSINPESRSGRIYFPAVLSAALFEIFRHLDRSLMAIGVVSVAGLLPTLLVQTQFDIRVAGAIGLSLGAVAGFVCITLFCGRATFARPWKIYLFELLGIGLLFGLLVGLPMLALAVWLPEEVTFAWRVLFDDDWLGWKFVAIGSVLLGTLPTGMIGWPLRVWSDLSFRDSVLSVWAGPEDDGVYRPWTVTAAAIGVGVALAWMPVLCLAVPVLIGAFSSALFVAVREAEE